MKHTLYKLFGVLMAFAFAHTASAYSISPSGVSDGTPGGLTIYQVQVGGADQGQSFDLQWGYTSSTDSVSAVGSFTVSKYDATNGLFDLSFSLTNTSAVTSSSNPRLTAFGFNFDKALTLKGVYDGADNALINSSNTVTSSSNKLNQYITSTTFSGFHQIDLCIYGGSNCSGGSNDGLLSGETDSFIARFSASTLPDPLTLSDFAMKFQGVGSYELPGQPGCDNGCTRVPEPGTVLLLGIGLLGFGMRRKANS